MSYDLSLILSNKVLLAMALLSLAAWPVLAWGAARLGMAGWDTGRVRAFFWVWLAAFTFEFWFLGPYSFIAWDGEGNLGVAMNALLAHQPDGWFSHRAAGGIDLALFFPGKQYLQPEVLTTRLLPVWVAILLHKMQVAALGFWGAWLLARHWLKERPGLALAAALPFPVSQDYLLNYSTEFGTGFAVIPLAVWAAVLAPRDRWYWGRAVLVAALVAFSEPMKVFPPLAIAMVAGAIIIWPRDLWRGVAVFVLCVVATLLNWHEVLYGLMLDSPLTTRLDMYDGHHAWRSLLKGLHLIYADVWVSGWQIIGGLAILAVLERDRGSDSTSKHPALDHRHFLRSFLATAWFVASFVFLEAFPWEDIGLAVVNDLTHTYNRLMLPCLAAMIAAQALAVAAERDMGRHMVRGGALLAGAGLALAVWIKLTNLGQLVWFGGQAAYFTHRNLQETAWRPDGDFRVITLFDNPHPNVVAAFYGFDCLDGGSNLDPRAYGDFWFKVLGERPGYDRTTRVRVEWNYWDGAQYHLAEQARLDLLRLANVRFVFSGLPLAGPGLKLVRTPKEGDAFTRVRPDFFPSMAAFLANRAKRLFDAGDLWIYELEGASPRLYAARQMVTLDDYGVGAAAERAVLLDGQAAVVAGPDSAARLRPSATMAVTGWQRRTDGYDVDVVAPDGGVLVVNNHHFKFWRAEADGQAPLAVEPANGAHMAVSVPPGARRITIRYDRPTIGGLITKGRGPGS